MTSDSLKCKFVVNLFKYRHIMERVSIDKPLMLGLSCKFTFRAFIYNLFNDAVCSLVCITLRSGMMNWYAFGREQP